MDEGKFAADFLATNINKIISLGLATFGAIDEGLNYQLKTAYTKYIEKTREKYSKAKSFFIRNHSVDLYSYYTPTGISKGTLNITTPKFKSCTNISKRIIISGTGGSGKSVLMRHLFLDCISNNQYTPIFIELRQLNQTNKTLEEIFNETLETFDFTLSNKYIEKAKKAGHFCYFLDGYDEVEHKKRPKLIKQLERLSNKYTSCPIFISSRPDDNLNSLEDFSIFSINPLTLESASDLIRKLPFDPDIKEKFVDDLGNGVFNNHESFLANPLLLSIMLLTYGENAQIPTKLSIFYNQAYEALFNRHDAYKSGFVRDRTCNLDIQDFSRVFSIFSLQTYEKRIFKMPRTECLNYINSARSLIHNDFNPEHYLEDALSAACLLIEEGLEVAFSHRSFQEYFVALYISTASPEIQEQLIKRYIKNYISDSVITLTHEINPEAVTRILIIPTLEKFFTDIGVKKTVGITHTEKYMKTCFNTLTIRESGTSAQLSNAGIQITAAIDFALETCKTYTFASDEEFMKHHKEIIDKHKIKENSKSYPIQSLTHRTPIFRDILNGPGTFSTNYLKSAHSAFIIMKEKHTRRESDLNSLLGIQ